MKKRLKILLMSMLTLCLSVAVVAGATYALFSDKAEVNNHLKAGSLKVGLERVNYEEKSLNDDGTLSLKPADSTVVDLVTSNAPLFNIEKAVPQSYSEATVKVINKGTVAFDYSVKMLFNTNNDATNEQKELSSQIEITITSSDSTKTFKLSECASEENTILLGTLLADSTNTFKVKASFVDSTNNNDVQLIDISFDMQVIAIQSV